MWTGSKLAFVFIGVVATGWSGVSSFSSPSRAVPLGSSTTRARRHPYQEILLSAKPAKSKEDDIEKTLSVILKHIEKFDDGAIADDGEDSKPAPKQAEESANGESGRKGLRQRAKRKIKSVLGK